MITRAVTMIWGKNSNGWIFIDHAGLILSHICANAQTITYQNIKVKFLLIKVLDKEIYIWVTAKFWKWLRLWEHQHCFAAVNETTGYMLSSCEKKMVMCLYFNGLLRCRLLISTTYSSYPSIAIDDLMTQETQASTPMVINCLVCDDLLSVGVKYRSLL